MTEQALDMMAELRALVAERSDQIARLDRTVPCAATKGS
jgi:hypothetical protein